MDPATQLFVHFYGPINSTRRPGCVTPIGLKRKSKPVLFRTISVIFRDNTVIIWTNPVIFRTNAVIFRTMLDRSLD